MELIVHHTISDLYKTLGLPVEEEIDFTLLSIPDIHAEIPFKSPNLRADYFSFILTKRGSGVYFLDENRFPFGSNSFYFTNPGHLKSYELNTSEEALIITLSEKFLTENVNAEIYQEFPFLLAEIVPPNTLSEEAFEEFDMLYRQMLIEFKKDSQYKNKILGNLFLVLLLKIKEQCWPTYNPIEEGNRNSQIVKTFKALLESEFSELLKGDQSTGKFRVQDFAERLSLHPNYLNSDIKSKTGKTLNDWLSEKTLAVAKLLLVSTSLSAKEIAYKLGFSEPTHFGRFFKKHTGLSPNAYRKSDTR